VNEKRFFNSVCPSLGRPNHVPSSPDQAGRLGDVPWTSHLEHILKTSKGRPRDVLIFS